MYDNIDKHLNENVITTIRNAIKEYHGNEIFFKGTYSLEKNIVDTIEILASGNAESTPAIINDLKPYDVVIHNHPDNYLIPSQQDVNIASITGNNGIGFYIVNNEVNNINIVVNVVPPERIEVSLESIVDNYSNPEKLPRLISNFEQRTEQVKMIEYMVETINDQGLLCIEAGTGIGKTIAYLMPAIEYVLESKNRIVISTNTISLQEQLILKDLPILKKIYGDKLNYILLKGRNNYVCLRKFYRMADENRLFKNNDVIEELEKWITHSATGSKSELSNELISEIWRDINSASETCSVKKCEFYKKCFVYKARKKALSSNILIVNHNMICADIMIKTENKMQLLSNFLPHYKGVIIDEAHSIDHVATDSFSKRLTYLKVMYKLNKIYNSRSRKVYGKGIIRYIIMSLKKSSYYESFIQFLDFLQEKLIPKIDRFSIESKMIFEDIGEIVLYLNRTYNKNTSKKGKVELQIDERVAADSRFTDNFIPKLEQLQSEMFDCIEILRELIKRLKNFADNNVHKEFFVSVIPDIQGIILTLKDYNYIIDTFINSTFTTAVKWMFVSKKRFNAGIVITPLEIKQILQPGLFEVNDFVTMTSATMEVNKSFDYVSSRLGINLYESLRSVNYVKLSSPFNYAENCQIIIPNDIHEYRSDYFFDYITDFFNEYLKFSIGGIFILTTSYSHLIKIYQGLKSLNIKNYSIMKQGDTYSYNLLSKFKKKSNNILVATDTFWQGVDIPGEMLQTVCIVKLPFKVPDNPIVSARIQYLQQQNQNPFINYQLPEAIIKFKQGIGRLIRSHNDYGQIIVLDKRIFTKNYGKSFRDALPPAPIISGTKSEILKKSQAFFGN